MYRIENVFVYCGKRAALCFPNAEIALCIYLCLMVSNLTEEGSFSKLPRIKNYLRSSVGQEKLSMLSLMSMGA